MKEAKPELKNKAIQKMAQRNWASSNSNPKNKATNE
jgi:hypothetical protein